MASSRLSLEELNHLDQASFVEQLGFVFEGPPWIVERAWEQRPFSSLEQLHTSLCAVMNSATEAEKVALIQAHPDLVGRAALAGTLTPESTGEQAAAGLSQLSADDIAAFTSFNGQYRDQFGFPFVICARENKKDSILAGFRARLQNPRSREIDTAMQEIAKIARLRLLDRLLESA